MEWYYYFLSLVHRRGIQDSKQSSVSILPFLTQAYYLSLSGDIKGCSMYMKNVYGI